MLRHLMIFWAGMLLALTACTPDATPTATVISGDLIYENTFDDPTSWQTFGFIETQFGILNGVYQAISPGGGYVVATNDHIHSDVVIEATITQDSPDNNNSYGLMCRAQPANDNIAYYFLISGQGRYTIRVGDGARVKVLSHWNEHPAIRQGQATNTMRVVCVDDYLALYINDRFVAEVRDDWLKEGYTGIAVNTLESVRVAVSVDDLTIHEASLATP